MMLNIMFTPVSVSLSGPAFSFLLYENSKCRFQQEGFLLGEIIQNETKTITDNDQQQVNITKTIKINSVMPCPYSHIFHKSSGKLDKEKITDFLGVHLNKVVAWYKYQHVGNLKFTLRDMMIHSQLTDFFEAQPELFTCCLLNNEISENQATHTFSQIFVRIVNKRIDRLPNSIPNLSEPNNNYRTSEPASETFKQILSNLNIDRRSTQGSVVINKIQNALQKHIDSVIHKLSKSEQYMHELEKDVQQLNSKRLNKENEYSAPANITPPRTSESEDNNRFSGIDTLDTPPSDTETFADILKKTGKGDSVHGRSGKRGPASVKETKATKRLTKTDRVIKTVED